MFVYEVNLLLDMFKGKVYIYVGMYILLWLFMMKLKLSDGYWLLIIMIYDFVFEVFLLLYYRFLKM